MKGFDRGNPAIVGVPLSEETKRRVEFLFDARDVATATKLLITECGANLPFLKELGPIELERFRFAALKLSWGNLVRLRQAIELAK